MLIKKTNNSIKNWSRGIIKILKRGNSNIKETLKGCSAFLRSWNGKQNFSKISTFTIHNGQAQ